MKATKSTVKRTDEEEVLKILSEQAPVGVCIMQDGKFCYVNSNFPLAIGYTADELMGKDPLELIVPEDREMVKENEIKMLKGKLIPPYQFRVIHKDGSIRWVMEVVKSVQYHGRWAVLGNYMEVTERQQMEEAVKQNEERYRELANSITDVFFAMDEHLRYTYWNKSSEILTGIRVEDAIGKSLREIFPDTPGIRKAEKVYHEVLRTQQSQTFVSGVNFGGKHYIFEISAYPSRGGISVFVKDITERKQIENKLKESEQKYRLLFETSLDCIARIDRDGRFLDANPAAARSLGVPLEELIGKTFFEVMPQEVAQRRLGNVRKVLDEWQPQIFEDERGGRYFHHIDIPIKISEQKEAVQVITRDITERKQAEMKLRQSEENYKNLFNNSVVGMYVMDAETFKIVVGNRAAREMAGFSSAEEGIGTNPFDFVVPEDREKVLEMAINEFLQDSRQAHEIQVMDKNGRRGWHSISIARIVYEGRPASLVSFTNITERKQAEKALELQRSYFQQLFDNSPDAIIRVDIDDRVIQANKAFETLFGYPAEEIKGRTIKELIIPEGYKEEASASARTLLGEEVYRKELVRRCKDGRLIDVDAVSYPVRLDGKLVGAYVIYSDITERKQAEEAVRRSEEKYRTILEEMEDSYFEVDLAGNITFANNSVCRDLGYSREELMGMSYKSHTAEGDIESVFRVFNEVYRTGVPNKGFPWKTIRKDGSHGFAETSVSLLRNDKGEIIGFRGVGRDVTERKQAEEKLRQSEENYKTLFDSAVVGMYVLDAETFKVVMGNRAAAEMAGFSSPGEGIGINPFDFVVPEDRAQFFEAAVKEFEQDLRRTHEVRVIGKDGGIGWISISGARITHEGRPASLVSITNITERKQAEDKLRQSQENYRALFDSSVIGALVVDAETMKVVMANGATMKMFGFSSSEEGVNPLHFVPPEDRQKNLERIVVEVFEKDSRKSIDISAVTKDGKKIWVSVTGARIMHKGKLAGLFSFTDITERKQGEEALRQSEENYRALFDSSVIGTVVLDAESMKIAMVNQAAVKMFGFNSAEEALGLDPFSFILPEDRERYLEITQKGVFEQNSHQTYEIKAMTKDGRGIWINTTATMITHKGKLAALISFADITEQKKQTELLMMTDRLASLGELASGAAHEINNPLTSIIGFSQLLLEKQVPDDIREDLKLINNEAQRAASVTKNLLTFARRHAPTKQRNQINNIIEDVLKLRTYEHKANGIEVKRQLAPDLPEIMVDYFQMQQVFMNIVINAEYFMTVAHNKGTLTITTKKQNDTVMISFADDGPGIPSENLRRIFDPFFTTKETGKGTGLGLSICHGIVTEHGGQIYAKSQLSKGTTIFVELPISGS